MRINEYNNLEEFTSQYCGWWDPSEGKWLGLEFKYNGKYYRFHTGIIGEKDKMILPNGKQGKFSVYKIICEKEQYPFADDYKLIGRYADMDDVLENCIIDDKKFKEVIMDNSTEILGQD